MLLTWASMDESYLDIKKLKRRTFQEKGILKAGNVRCEMVFFGRSRGKGSNEMCDWKDSLDLFNTVGALVVLQKEVGTQRP